MRRSSPLSYVYSSDNWDRRSVRELDHLLALQRHDSKSASAVVIGSGGLPYLLGHELGVSTVDVVDVYRDVIDTTIQRVTALAMPEYTSWRGYERVTRQDAGQQRTVYDSERNVAQHSGLRGNFKRTQVAAAQVELVPRQGDFLAIAGQIGQAAVEAGIQITFVNLTNIGDYLHEDDDPYGRHAIVAALGRLPLAQDVIIVDSSGPGIAMRPQFYAGLESYAVGL